MLDRWRWESYVPDRFLKHGIIKKNRIQLEVFHVHKHIISRISFWISFSSFGAIRKRFEAENYKDKINKSGLSLVQILSFYDNFNPSNKSGYFLEIFLLLPEVLWSIFCIAECDKT